jgi:diguanylate cyclase (GGDEF)-like protein
MTEPAEKQITDLALQPVQFLDGEASMRAVRRRLSAPVDALSARQILEHLLVLGLPETGVIYLHAVVEALNARLQATSIFIAFRPTPSSDQVQVLAALKDGAPRELWEYSLASNPCELVYDGEAALIPSRLTEHFPGKRDSGYQSFIGVPLLTNNGEVIGHIAIYDAEPVSDSELRVALVQVLAARAACELEREHSLSRLKVQATTDDLTGLLNRRGFNAVATAKFHGAGRSDQRLYFVAFDLNSFKAVNDSYGHSIGDAVLVAFAHSLIAGFTRCSDVLARVGGDEFVALVNAADREEVERIAMQVQSKFSRTAVSTPLDEVFGACSFGIAEHDEHDRVFEALAARADAALYSAKPKTRPGR